MLFSTTTALLLTSLFAAGTPLPVADDLHHLETRASACTAYTLIDTRGTGELQGPSAGFITMNRNIQSAVPGGKVYNTVYAAGFDQNSAAGTQDILNRISTELASDPNHCFILEGYSQGASATVNALKQINTSDRRFNAVKGVFLIGDPQHRSGLACNVDTNGGTTTKNVNGLSAVLGGIPAAWVSKTLDVCNFGDGVCDTTHGFGINAAHLAYPGDAGTQRQGTDFVVARLQSGGSGNGGGATPTSAAAPPPAATTTCRYFWLCRG